jgi:hypothetical protein
MEAGLHDQYVPAGEGGVANAFNTKSVSNLPEGYGMRSELSRI